MPPFGLINYAAVAVCVVVAMAVGALWHSPFLFGRIWMKAYGYSPEEAAAMRRRALPAYLISAASYLLMSLALSVLAIWGGYDTWAKGLQLGLMVWVAIVAPTGLINNRFSDKPLAAWLIDSAWEFLYLLFMGGLLAAWA
ncbi:MAG: DUF1761 domain-containing protein [Acidiferrobacteraceae bacterium]|jgi:hypothetical protein